MVACDSCRNFCILAIVDTLGIFFKFIDDLSPFESQQNIVGRLCATSINHPKAMSTRRPGRKKLFIFIEGERGDVTGQNGGAVRATGQEGHHE
jgi:hypothetical protein